MAALHPMLPRIPLPFLASRAPCWLTCSLVSTRTPGPFLQSQFPAGWPQHVLVPGIFPPQVWDFAVLLALFVILLSAHLQLLYEDLTGDNVENLSEVQIDNIHCSPLVY